MTEPNETNEQVNEELSTDELEGVSGGIDGGHFEPKPIDEESKVVEMKKGYTNEPTYSMKKHGIGKKDVWG